MENPPTRIRLNRYLSQCGLGSRRRCDRLIRAGCISVNGKKIAELGVKVNPCTDTVFVRGRTVGRVRALEYIAYHKSKGTIVSASDERGRKTIYDGLKKSGCDAAHLKYVGRLDRNSEGLLLLTNDGDLVHALTHPRFEIKKVYTVRTDKPLEKEHISTMTVEGIRSEGHMLHAAKIRPLEAGKASGQHWCEVVLYEGKNRQIRRMFESLGYEILRLKRVQFGVIKLGNLRRGAQRRLSAREVLGLKRLGWHKAKKAAQEAHRCNRKK
jgi:pseudouridine synthase